MTTIRSGGSKFGSLAYLFLCVFVASGFNLARGAEAYSKAPRGFAEIARDKKASAAQKRTVALIMKQTGASSFEEAERQLGSSTDLIFYGDEESFISDLSHLGSFTQAELLVLYNNKVADISPLAGFAKLKNIRLERNAISDITPLQNLKNLESLQITDNAISDLATLSGLKSLRTLWISDNKISDISPLVGLDSLRDLHLSGNSIADLTPLTKLSVSDFRLQNCGLADISALENLNTDIEAGITLDLSQNKISDIKPLADLRNLRHLDLSNNQISDVSAMERSSVAYLDLRNNRIVDVAPLTKMRELSSLDVRGNPVRDYAPLVELQKSRAGINIVADAEFEEALARSMPEKAELKESPLVGRWVSSPIDTQEFGTLRIDMTFGKNGQLTTRLQFGAPDTQWMQGDSPANPPQRSSFRVEDGIFINENTGDQTPFEIKGDTLIITSGSQKISLRRQVPGKPLKPEREPFKFDGTPSPQGRTILEVPRSGP